MQHPTRQKDTLQMTAVNPVITLTFDHTCTAAKTSSAAHVNEI